jgi:hypothetical protein
MEPVNRRIVIALGSALGLSLLIIAFLLGRLSANPPVVTLATPASNPSASEPVALAAPESPAPSIEAAAADPATPLSPPAGSSTPVQEIAPLPSSSNGPIETSPESQQVAAYFAEVDRLEDMGAGDPQAFASSMMQSLSSGDFTEFDKLLEKARGQKQRLLAIVPPSACAEHHRLARTLSADSVVMLERLKAALMKGDSMALMGIASDGKTLETQANQLKAMSETIKRQAGV